MRRFCWSAPLTLVCACGGPDAEGELTAFAEPDPLEVDGAHYMVEWETDRVRVLRVHLPPGHRSPQHRHPEYCAVFLTPATWRFTDAEGVVAEAESDRGSVSCVPAEVHSPENVGSEPADLLLIEFTDEGG